MPPIFVVGCPRSGTTLLRNLLRSHPRLTLPPESHFIPYLYEGHGDPRSAREARRLAGTILRTQWIRDWELDLTPRDFASCRSYREVVSLLFDTWARREGKPRWGDKTPQYVAKIAILREIFPDCQIVHIIRDGRDVALSWIGFRYGPGNVLVAAQRWQEYVRAGRRAGAALPVDVYQEMRYETLVTKPEASLRRLYAFLGEPYYPPVLAPRAQSKRPFWLGSQASTLATRTEVVRSSAGGWRERMTLSDRVLFESAAGDLLEELGYQTEGLARALSRREQLFWQLQHAAWYLFWRLNRKRKCQWLAGELGLRWTTIRRRLRRSG